ncbi:GCN5-related N-acetyltransferase [Halalkaliarchaeum desulfuricum]|uniref:GCN5-related N-acetyltransferase n=1 Tax=Halalkaliarchaeum desulfuricum TaxID=2055893 RepID=A0A343TM49_9EURY|nr:GNAT family N-acetyltransferase [Halalkaliarchaeum desulfuricum]AUX10171.1 GCN5-related N-acetyltransferase [Halalkaliarchaeum desulfuricum]
MTDRDETPTADLDVTVRQAKPDDEDAVVAFTADTWSDRDASDYIPRVFSEWVETDGPTQRTFVLDVEDDAGGDQDVAGICQGVLLSDHEAWAQGMRVNPDYRGMGISRLLTDAIFEWARDRGATVIRNMVFSWNVAGLGQSRAAGFDPCTEFRYARPDPDADAEPALSVGADAAGAWTFWGQSEIRTHLCGLAMDDSESWALSELTPEKLQTAAAEDRLFTVHDRGVRGFTYRDRTFERENEDGETEEWALYAVGAWDTSKAAASLFAAVARDAATVGVDNVRVMIPEGVEWISDVAAARVPVAAEPDFVMAADLTDPALVPEDGRL